jgi:hypothetical protein
MEVVYMCTSNISLICKNIKIIQEIRYHFDVSIRLYGEFDHIPTGIYIPVDTLNDTLLLIFTFAIDNHSQF